MKRPIRRICIKLPEKASAGMLATAVRAVERKYPQYDIQPVNDPRAAHVCYVLDMSGSRRSLKHISS